MGGGSDGRKGKKDTGERERRRRRDGRRKGVRECEGCRGGWLRERVGGE